MANTNQERFAMACCQAKRDSEAGCVQHVNAVLRVGEHGPEIVNYSTSNWTDGSTVRSYFNGHQQGD